MSRIIDDFEYNSAEDSDFTENDAVAAEAINREGGSEDEALSDSERKGKKKQAAKKRVYEVAHVPRAAGDFTKMKKTKTIGAAVLSSSDDEQEPQQPQPHSLSQHEATRAAEDENNKEKEQEQQKPADDKSAVPAPAPAPVPSSSSSSLGALLASFNRPKAANAQATKKTINWWEKKPQAAAPAAPAVSSEEPSLSSSVPSSSPSSSAPVGSSGRALTGGGVAVTEYIKFAGETVAVEKTLVVGTEEEKAHRDKQKKKDNLSDILQSLGQRKEISTLEKSRIDWTISKEKEGDADELKQFTKDGFVEKQAFLARADQRQYEQLKAIQKKARPQVSMNESIKERMKGANLAAAAAMANVDSNGGFGGPGP